MKRAATQIYREAAAVTTIDGRVQEIEPGIVGLLIQEVVHIGSDHAFVLCPILR